MEPKVYTDKELCDLFASGTTSYGKVNVVMRGERFVIIRDPGRNWSDRGGSHYGQTKYTLLSQGAWCLCRGFRKEWYGRVSKKILKQALDEAEAKAVVNAQSQ